ncbi:MAG: YncE family protein [Bryobacteraceae bacterium]|nr:YncE family protein [Bryobacteraceae bacterium]MDW8378219.1 YncE family protein [Bryobacterales bacterium]
MFQVLSRRAFLASAGWLAACSRKPKPGYSGYAFVANEEDRAVAAVDLNALTLVRHIRLDAAPISLLSEARRKSVYALTAEKGIVYEISSRTLERVRWNTICMQASGMKARPGGESLWVLSRKPRQLIEVELEGFTPRRRIELPEDCGDFDLSPQGQKALVPFPQTGQVALVDLETGAIRRVDCGSAVSQARFRKDGRQWIAAHQDRRLLSIFDTASSRLVVRLPLAVRPHHLCFKADGGQLFVTGEGMDAVVIVFPYSTEVAETVVAGNAPGAMAVSSREPEFLFVANPRAGQVTILNIDTRKMVGATQVGSEPHQIVVTPDNQFALVVNRQSGDLAVIYITPTAKRTRAPAALLTMVPVGSKPVSAVVQAV